MEISLGEMGRIREKYIFWRKTNQYLNFVHVNLEILIRHLYQIRLIALNYYLVIPVGRLCSSAPLISGLAIWFALANEMWIEGHVPLLTKAWRIIVWFPHHFSPLEVVPSENYTLIRALQLTKRQHLMRAQINFGIMCWYLGAYLLLYHNLA